LQKHCVLELQCLGDVPVFCEGGIVLTSRVILGALREEVKIDLVKLLHVFSKEEYNF
jgi:hypothetical protein